MPTDLWQDVLEGGREHADDDADIVPADDPLAHPMDHLADECDANEDSMWSGLVARVSNRIKRRSDKSKRRAAKCSASSPAHMVATATSSVSTDDD